MDNNISNIKVFNLYNAAQHIIFSIKRGLLIKCCDSCGWCSSYIKYHHIKEDNTYKYSFRCSCCDEELK